MDRTFLMIKPRAVAEHLVGGIVTAIEEAGFEIIGLVSRRLRRDEAAILYEAHVGKPFYEPLVAYMTEGPVIGLVLAAPDAIAAARKLVGATDPEKAEPGTIRALYGKTVQMNAVHACDSSERFERESGIFFGDCPRAVTA
jgi:nucleoside-diphosphate kinase